MKEQWIKIDPHVHSKAISRCSHVTCEQIIEEKIRMGYGGAILTNHCQAWYYPESEHKAYVEEVLADFQRGKAYAETKGFRFYLGLEVSLMQPHYADWLLYGITEEFLRNTPCLYTLSQKELFELCQESGVLLIQAHPYRQTPGDPAYMHGVEINCSDGDLDKIPLVETFAAEHGLLVTCGTDYHAPSRTYHGGIYVPAWCETAADIAKYMREEGEIRVFYGGTEKSFSIKV
ncbi:MAG: PHP domain-containing protein [Clostridia bacterium]|nr:PHP domain-containing protein [Clostridia bacterium]